MKVKFILITGLLLALISFGGLAVAENGVSEIITSDYEVNYGDQFNLLDGVYGYDMYGDAVDNIGVAGSIDTLVPGEYFITYSFTDLNNQVITASRKLTVLEKAKPEILFEDVTLPFGTEISLMDGVTVTDAVGKDYSDLIEITGSVNFQKTGTYKITYSLKDDSGSIISAVRTIVVQPYRNPVINFGNSTIKIGTKFNLISDVTATDNFNEDISSNIKVVGTVNTSKIGKYTVTYTVTDKKGHSTTSKRVITVIGLDKPIISGAVNGSISVGDSFNPKTGVTAVDDLGNDLTKSIVVSGSVNNKKPGNYKLVYQVKDKYGNKSSITRTISVNYFIKPGSEYIQEKEPNAMNGNRLTRESTVIRGNLSDQKDLDNFVFTTNKTYNVDVYIKFSYPGEVYTNDIGICLAHVTNSNLYFSSFGKTSSSTGGQFFQAKNIPPGTYEVSVWNSTGWSIMRNFTYYLVVQFSRD